MPLNSPAVLLFIVVGALPVSAFAQDQRDVIRGRVTGDSAKPVPSAQVIATRAPDRAIFRATSDSSGRYEIVVDSGTGDYLVHISLPTQPTWAPTRKRVTRAGPADTVFVVDVVLKAPVQVAQKLAAVTVEAAKPTPTRSVSQFGADVGGDDRDKFGVNAALSPDQKGDLTAIAATMPGVISTGDGFSVLGLPASQNQTTLNGMAFPGASLPRNAPLNT